MTRYMLDTNIVSHLILGHPTVTQRITAVAMASICISAVTEGELMYGLARRPGAKRLHALVEELLRRVTVLPWTSRAARRYGLVRAALERSGQSLSPLDLLIAAHAQEASALLVTNDQAFGYVPDLTTEDWTQSPL